MITPGTEAARKARDDLRQKQHDLAELELKIAKERIEGPPPF
ncbi:MAG: hypothetical protein ACPHN2_04410 [Sinimarinibacterium flocculans]